MKEDNETVKDLLGMVDCVVTDKEINSWSADKREKIMQWAAKVHLRASDNIVQVPKKPEFNSIPVSYGGI